MPDEPTLGEALRRLDKIEQRIDSRLVSLGTYSAERKHDQDAVTVLDRRTAKLESRIDWAYRAAVTGIVMPVVVGVMLFLLLRSR
jgi:tetrahydromethanopterin S-methyltransferase subunit G